MLRTVTRRLPWAPGVGADTSRLTRRRWWITAGVGALVVAGTLAGIWGLVGDGPDGGICPAVLPAPPGCADRLPAAITWTAVLLVAYGAVLVLTARARRRLVAAGAGLLLLGVLAVVAYRSTLWAGAVG